MSVENPTVNIKAPKSTNPTVRQLKKLFRNKLAVVGVTIIVLITLACIFAPLITSYDPNEVSLSQRTLAPSSEHLLGTDKIGRDIFSRILYGGRISIFIGLLGALSGSLIGVVLGCVAGYTGGIFDKIIVRVSEIFMSFPQLILVLIMVVFFGQGLWNLIIVFTATGWMGTFRLVRGRFMSLREESFVETCRAFGIKNKSIMFRHILPNTLGPVIVNITLAVAGYILQEASLSFLGMGVGSGTATWGNIINAAKSVDVIINYWWLWIPPGIVISVFVLGVNFFGDGLRDVFDPTR